MASHLSNAFEQNFSKFEIVAIVLFSKIRTSFLGIEKTDIKKNTFYVYRQGESKVLNCDNFLLYSVKN